MSHPKYVEYTYTRNVIIYSKSHYNGAPVFYLSFLIPVLIGSIGYCSETNSEPREVG